MFAYHRFLISYILPPSYLASFSVGENCKFNITFIQMVRGYVLFYCIINGLPQYLRPVYKNPYISYTTEHDILVMMIQFRYYKQHRQDASSRSIGGLNNLTFSVPSLLPQLQLLRHSFADTSLRCYSEHKIVSSLLSISR